MLILLRKLKAGAGLGCDCLIDNEDVLVNGRAVKSSYKVSENDEIEVELTPTTLANFTPENIPLDVVFEMTS